MQAISEDKVGSFSDPTKLPQGDAENADWQRQNREWWQSHPMNYDWYDQIGAPEGSPEYFEAIDREFFGSAQRYMPWRERPFDALIDFGSLAKKDVLEIGVGFGSHAQLIAPHCRSYTGIDLTPRAAAATTRRLEQKGIAARILQMDAESLQFPDASFDYIWSWGVIHHSANTARIIEQMHRVLRPGGSATVMIYHRSLWRYYVVNGLFRGLLAGKLWKDGSIHTITQKATDGAIARFYRESEWRALVQRFFHVSDFRVYGMRNQIVPLPDGRAKRWVMDAVPDRVWRIFSNRLGFGPFLVANMYRR